MKFFSHNVMNIYNEILENNLENLTEKVKEKILGLSNLEKAQLFWMIDDLSIHVKNLFPIEIELWESFTRIFRHELSNGNISDEEISQNLLFLESGILTKKLNLEDGRSIVRYLYTHANDPSYAISQINNMIVNITHDFDESTKDPLWIIQELIQYFGIPPENFEELAKSVLISFPRTKGELNELKSTPVVTCQKYPEYILETAENLDFDSIISLIRPWINHSLLNEITKQKMAHFNENIIFKDFSSNDEFISHLINERKKENVSKIPFTFLSSIKPHIQKIKPISVRMEELPSSIPPKILPSYIEKHAYSILPRINKEVRITFLGGAQIGTMGILVKTSQSTILIDFGLSVANYQIPSWNEALPYIDAIFLTHAHLDHSGAIPYLISQGFSGSIFGSSMTYNLTNILLSDSQKLMKENFFEPVNQYDYRFKALIQESFLYQIQDHFIPIKSGKEYQITPDIAVKPFNAFHIQGSLAYQIITNDKKIFYTGDINFDPSELFHNKTPQVPLDSDITILDSTYYGQPDFDPRTRDKLLYQTINESKRTIIPAFSIGRAQELLLKLENLGITKDKKVITLGMASKVARLSGIETKGYISDQLASPFEEEIIITGGGMLNGGFARKLVEETKTDPKTSVVLCGYLAQNTLGYRLLNKIEPEYKQNIVYTRFSGHSSNKTLKKVIKQIKGKKVLVHLGELSKDPLLLKDSKFREKCAGKNVIIPHKGSSISV
ncbi:MAG: MBL fold metallo-hydrolase [Candidatus Hodarchaeales archaeon]